MSHALPAWNYDGRQGGNAPLTVGEFIEKDARPSGIIGSV